ncbi:MAG: mechanosensitive ion channel family protein [Methylotenera sp.]|uniref:mechanosensitive ion channel family protein n=1 Tax=Methylotenera sp. TaxID=2051956 RepID=UPI0024893D0C|nr:mechanosensitive ion channel family protein [Methylotenera sp.]MDI1309872.1 mechanosensitive ion channel family protein [Methylotenera sp.]
MLNLLKETLFLNIPLSEWLVFICLTIIYFLLIIAAWKFTLDKAIAISLKTSNKFDDLLVEVLKATNKLTLGFFAILLGIRVLDFPEKWSDRLDSLTVVMVGIQLTLWLTKCIGIWTNMRLTTHDGEQPNPIITAMLSWIFKAFIWSVLLLTIMASMGINITAFVASLGIGGIAIALAVQNILSDLFASLAIGLDKPFVIGDFIVFNNVAGNIERVGLKTTHIRSIEGEQIVCSNMELLKNTIHNYKRMSQRRVLFKLSLSYSTSVEKLEMIPMVIKTIIEKIDHTRFDRAHFKSFSELSLDYEVVYFIDTNDFGLYMDIQQSINLAIMKVLKNLEVEFALPYLAGNNIKVQMSNTEV